MSDATTLSPTFNLEVNATYGFATAEEARTVGQAITTLLHSGVHGAGGAKITQLPGFVAVPLYPQTFDRSKVVHGSQEAEGLANSLVKELVKSEQVSDVAESHWDDFIRGAAKAGAVNYAQLTDLVSGLCGDASPAGVVAAAAGSVAAAQVARELRPAPVKKVKATPVKGELKAARLAAEKAAREAI